VFSCSATAGDRGTRGQTADDGAAKTEVVSGISFESLDMFECQIIGIMSTSN